MLDFLHRPGWLRAAALLVAASVVACVEWLAPGVPRSIEATAGDFFWRLGAAERSERRFLIVDIDERSLSAVGAWPWPRATVADLINALGRAGAGVVVLDIVFPDARPGDAELAAAWRSNPVVPGQIFSLDPAVQPRVGEVAGAVEGPCAPDIPRSHGSIGNATGLLVSGTVTGHLTPILDGDGVVRRVPALVCHGGRAYPALILAALSRMAAAGPGGNHAPDWRLVAAGRGAAALFGPPARIESHRLPGLSLPVDGTASIRVPYRLARGSFASISAADVLSGRFEASLVRGAIVLVGATAFGIGDTIATPLVPVASGLEVHAQLLAAVLDRRVPYEPRGVMMLHVAAMLASSLLLLAGLRGRVPARRLPIAGGVIALAVAGSAAWLLVGVDLWYPWAPVALFALIASSALATAEHALAGAQRDRVSAHLAAYLPRAMADRLMAMDPTGTLDIARRDISVLVADIRNFSAFAAQRPPEETAALLHAFATIAVEVVERHGGVVENFVGDSVVATWNAHGDCPDHARRALQAARELIAATWPWLASVKLPPGEGPLQPLAVGVGVESGPSIVGSYGPSRRRANAALGEPVSVAWRLQQMTEDLSIPLLIGPQLAKAIPAQEMQPLGEYLLAGMSRHYAIYAPADWTRLLPTEARWQAAPAPAPPGDDAGALRRVPPAGLQVRPEPGV